VRTFTAGLVIAALLTGGLGTPAEAAAPVPATQPYLPSQETPLGFNGDARLAVVGDRVLVADPEGGRILVLAPNGSTVATIANQSWASSMTPSADGSKVYVTLTGAAAISVIDLATGTEQSRIPVDVCPRSAAISSGRLFYTFGCSSYDIGVASVDPEAPAAPVRALTGNYSPALRATSTHLAVSTTGIAPTLSSYATSADGSVLPAATVPGTYNDVYDLTLSADGSRLLVAAGSPSNQVTALSFPGLQPTAAYPGAAWAKAVAISPDGSHVAVGTDAADTVRMYDAASETMLWHRYAVDGRTWDTWDEEHRSVASGALAFSADGNTLYAVTTGNGQTRLFRSATTVSGTRTYLSLDSIYGRPILAKVTVQGADTGVVAFALRFDGSVSPMGTAPLMNGSATKTLTVKWAGELIAYYVGDLAHTPSASPYVDFKSPSRVTLTMNGPHTTAKGVARYASFEDVRVKVKLEPTLRDKDLVVTLWKWRKGKWREQGTEQLRTNKKSRVVIVFGRHVGGRLCFTTWWAGDANQAGTGTVGPPFTMAA